MAPASGNRARSARIPAWIALAAILIAAVALGALVTRNTGAVVVMLAALFCAGAAAWIALTRHGALRYLGALTAVAVLVGGVVGVVVLGAADELLIFAGAVVLAIASTRTALTRAYRASAAELQAAPAAAARRSSPSRSVLIMNPKSGGGKVEKFDLVNEARRRGIEPIL